MVAVAGIIITAVQLPFAVDIGAGFMVKAFFQIRVTQGHQRNFRQLVEEEEQEEEEKENQKGDQSSKRNYRNN